MITVLSITFLVLAAAVTGVLQHTCVIASLVLWSFHYYFKGRWTLDLTIASLLLTGLYVGFTYWQYMNAVSLGFRDGILYGPVGGINYDDMHSYYYVSAWTALVLGGPASDLWWAGALQTPESFNMYHPFVVFNAVLRLIWGNDLITMILIKLHFSVFSTYLLYNISRTYLQHKYALGVVFLFGVIPSNILVSTSLLRDNLLVFLVFSFVYTVIVWREKPSTPRLVLVVITAVFMIVFRIYLALVPMAVLLYYVLKTRLTWKLSVLYVVLLVSGYVALFSVSSVFSLVLQLMERTQIGPAWEVKTTEGVKLYLYWFYYLFLGPAFVVEETHFSILQDALNKVSYLYLNHVAVLFLLSLVGLVLSRQRVDKKALIVFGFVLPSSLLLLHNLVLGFPIPRIYLMWIWIELIIIVHFLARLPSNSRAVLIGSTTGLVLLYTLLRQ